MRIAPPDSSILQHSAINLSHLLHSRQVKAVDLMHETLQRIEDVNPKINAVVSLHLDYERLMDEARCADKLLDAAAADADDDGSIMIPCN